MSTINKLAIMQVPTSIILSEQVLLSFQKKDNTASYTFII